MRDDLGRITEKTENILGTTTEYDYTYDSTGRLTDVTLNDVLYQHYDYDDNSNGWLLFTCFHLIILLVIDIVEKGDHKDNGH